MNVQLTAGAETRALVHGRILVDTNVARADHLRIGSRVRVRFAQTGPDTLVVGGIFKPNPLIGSYVVGECYFVKQYSDHRLAAVLLTTRAGGPDLEAALRRLLRPYAGVSAKTKAQFKAADGEKQMAVDSWAARRCGP